MTRAALCELGADEQCGYIHKRGADDKVANKPYITTKSCHAPQTLFIVSKIDFPQIQSSIKCYGKLYCSIKVQAVFAFSKIIFYVHVH